MHLEESNTHLTSLFLEIPTLTIFISVYIVDSSRIHAIPFSIGLFLNCNKSLNLGSPVAITHLCFILSSIVLLPTICCAILLLFIAISIASFVDAPSRAEESVFIFMMIPPLSNYFILPYSTGTISNQNCCSHVYFFIIV